ncbi:MAG: hypothetical protein AWU55_3039 [Halomonadaceae bacterium T82-2]|nr:MAG: hypothetical protein AWU55_3039 [Halomonadaceae bacterium T82-2]
MTEEDLCALSAEECQRLVEEHECLIQETRALMARFEATGMDEGMDEAMDDDYRQLHEIYTKAVNEQRRHTRAMLKRGE